MLMISLINHRRNERPAERLQSAGKWGLIAKTSLFCGGKMQTCYLRFAAISAAVLTASAATAHHGFGNFDRSREVSVEGVITSIDFVNPHAYVYFEAANADGTKTARR